MATALHSAAPAASAPVRSSLPGYALALLSAILLNYCFPVAGPVPVWRTGLAWIALTPLLYALLCRATAESPRPLRSATLTAYLCGVVWYVLNCYWIYQTMFYYGHVPPVGSAGIVLLFSLILGLYFALFGFLVAYFRLRFGVWAALGLAPFAWTGIELAGARVTSVPWDQLGYAQVDNLWLTKIAPVTGVYGISFILVAVSALLTAALVAAPFRARAMAGAVAVVLAGALQCGCFVSPAASPTSNYAVMLQPNIDVATDDHWIGEEWDGQVAWILQQSLSTCSEAYAGLPQRQTALTTPACDRNVTAPGVVVWPEVASWFMSDRPQTIAAMRAIAETAHAPVIAGMLGHDASGTYNSAVFTNPDGQIVGRYDKIHLVPFGEYIPYRNLLFFAHKLTQQVGDLQRGRARNVFQTDGHTFGTIICYESVFADEVRLFVKNGAQVLVNISDDGWYGDTSAPWQHLYMTRMRAIENHRWVLLDTNSGVTTAIDPRGRVTVSAPRHALTSLVARYGYESDVTFYTQYGDVFAYLCVLAVCAAAGGALLTKRRSAV
ncbi:apolipoprotein N-acyltransferase [Paracidobacterium acidisoli]|uniref:apolipoprotein N-acyltransferase n=1 Tax=Paracidobacterium acidisoli TaxID=2303751 RepID=UPI0013142DE0|nr:apolipoprotein N-acyltransferase [Paracidobacterium acidisoli]